MLSPAQLRWYSYHTSSTRKFPCRASCELRSKEVDTRVPKKRSENAKKLNPRKAPTYFINEAAHYLRLPTSTVRQWITARNRYTQPLVVPADRDYPLLSFENLLELHVLCSLRRVHQLKLNPVRKAISYLRREFSSEHPLIDHEMLTDKKSLFIERYGEMVNISDSGQLQMKLMLDNYLKRIEWDNEGNPFRLFPFTRTDLDSSPQLIAIDPRIKSGKPCIYGTGIPSRIIAERHEAGDPIQVLADDYGRSLEEIEESLRYESRIAA
jgi:uncharacterized protein (DUF433 family)